MTMKTYVGVRTIDGLVVTVDGKALDERYDIKKYTDWGFEWTYEGAEPSQLALAILAEHFGDVDKALEECDDFMRTVVANLDNEWMLTSEEINKALAAIS